MDIKEAGIATVVVIGGAVIGISEYGLGDVMSDDLRPAAEVPMDERQAYMTGVAAEFTEFFNGAVYGTDSFSFSGTLNFEVEPRTATFEEVVQAEQSLNAKQVKELKAYHADDWMCETEDTLLFTDKGWTYTTTLKNQDGRLMLSVECAPTNIQPEKPNLRGLS